MSITGTISKFSPILKAVLVFILVLLLFIPVSMIEGIINERQSLRYNAVRELSNTWGGQQVVHSPVLKLDYITKNNIQFKDPEGNEKTRVEEIKKSISLSPFSNNTNINVDPLTKERGLYSVNVYNSSISSKGEFGDIGARLLEKGLSYSEIESIYNSEILVGISHLNALENVSANISGMISEFKISDRSQVFLRQGYEVDYMRISNAEESIQYGNVPTIYTKLDIKKNTTYKNEELDSISIDKINYDMTLEIRGTEVLGYVPIGKNNKIDMKSSWTSPKFVGGFATSENNITGTGFDASWKILGMNLEYPDAWTDILEIGDKSVIGLELYTPVDNYKKTERAIKYAILIIVLVFVMYFFSEMKDRYRIHPVHYVLVGISIALFYLLLLSFSEIVGFNTSYIIASLMVVGLLALYTKAISNSKVLYKVITLLQVFIFSFVFVLLSLESYALVAGSIGIFVILSVLMYYATRIDWYNISLKSSDTE